MNVWEVKVAQHSRSFVCETVHGFDLVSRPLDSKQSWDSLTWSC